MKITTQIILPGTSEWQTFLSLCYVYFQENWPKLIEGYSEECFKCFYEKKLNQRYDEGGRVFLLFFSKLQEIVGLANIYKSGGSLFIAEFYVLPSFRKKGVGTAMKNYIMEWGKSQDLSEIKIEVDKELSIANQFWSHFFSLNPEGKRNLYYGPII